MADVVVFGVVAVDVVLRVRALPNPGDHVSAEALGWRLGGSSANVACGLSSAGHHVTLVGPVGSDPIGDKLVADLGQRGIDTSYLFRVPAPSPRALVVLDANGERTIIGLAGAADNGQPPSAHSPETAPDLASADCVYIESYTRYPQRLADEATLVVTSPPVAGYSDWPADVIVGSETQYTDAAQPAPFASVRAVAGPRLRWVVETRGQLGADAYGPERHVHAAAPPTRQVDATGAGDAFTAGLIHGLLMGDDIVAALDIASAWGAEAVTRLQSVPPDWAELVVRRPAAPTT